jgi:hypothetical protein
MALETVGYIFNALSQLFETDIERQWNRVTFMLDKIQATAGVSEGSGKNVAFGAEFTGATAGTVAEGADVASGEYNSDVNEPAFFPWATYRSSFWISEQEVSICRASMGSPRALLDIFGERIFGCQAKLAQSIENDVLNGTGVDSNGNPTIIGIFGGALSASGAYGGLNPATYPEWASNVVSNGGTLRALVPDLMHQLDQLIFTAASLPWDLIVTDAAIVRKYAEFFTQGAPTGVTAVQPLVRMNDGGANPTYSMGPAMDQRGQLPSLMWQGHEIQRNPLAPANKMAFLKTDKILMKYLKYVPGKAERELFEMLGLAGATGNEPKMATGIPARVASLAKTGDSYKLTMNAVVAMAIKRRNACGTIVDIAES